MLNENRVFERCELIWGADWRDILGLYAQDNQFARLLLKGAADTEEHLDSMLFQLCAWITSPERLQKALYIGCKTK